LNPTPKKPADLLITNGTLLTLAKNSKRLFPGRRHRWKSNCRFRGLRKIASEYIAARTLEASGCLVMPGLVNAHTHAAMTCYRGMADDLPLMEWLNRYIFPAETGSDGDQVYWSTLLACAEMIRSGTTTFFDIVLV